MKPVKLYAHDMKKQGELRFGNHILPIYNDLYEPLFKSSDVAEFVCYGGPLVDFNKWTIPRACEADEYYLVPYDDDTEEKDMQYYLDERGLYSILAFSRNQTARLWRRAIFDELIRIRKENGINIAERFEEWDHSIDDYYFDDSTEKMMRSVTLPGGDVEQVEVKE